MTEIKQETISIYVETLFTLARDAWARGELEAFHFVKGYLVGLVPGNALQAFYDGLEPSPAAIRDAAKRGNGNGGALVTNPVPPPRLPPSPTRLSLDDIVKTR